MLSQLQLSVRIVRSDEIAQIQPKIHSRHASADA
jgi:hypothetical protein